MAQKKPASAVTEAQAPNIPRRAALVNRGFLLTNSQLPGAQARVTIRPDKATNLLIGKGLPQLPAGQINRLWAEHLGSPRMHDLQARSEGNAIIKVPREPSSSAISLLVALIRFTKVHQPESLESRFSQAFDQNYDSCGESGRRAKLILKKVNQV